MSDAQSGDCGGKRALLACVAAMALSSGLAARAPARPAGVR